MTGRRLVTGRRRYNGPNDAVDHQCPEGFAKREQSGLIFMDTSGLPIDKITLGRESRQAY